MTAPDEKLVIDVIVRDKDGVRTFDKVGDAAVRTGKDFDKASDGAGKLQAQIDQTTITLRELGREFDKTGDRALLKDIGRERRTLAGLTKLRKEMAGLAGDAAKFSLSGLTGAIEALPQQVKGAAIVAGVGVATVIGPAVGAAIVGAVVGAVGSGAVAAGIASAARSPQVRSAWQEFADDAESVFADFGMPFVQPTVEAIGILRGSLASVADDLAAIAADAAGFVEPLARGVGGFVAEMMPGIRALVHDAAPVFEMLEDELPRLGRVVGDFFADLGDGAEGGADSLRALLRVAEFTLSGIGEQLKIYANAIDGASKLNEKFGGTLNFLLGDAGKKAKDTAPELNDLAEAADDVAWSVKGMSDAFSDWLGLALDAEGAADRFKLSLYDLDDAVAENGRSLDDNTEGGLKNQQMLRDLVREADAARRAEIEHAGGTEEAIARANAAYESNIRQIVEVGVKAGFSRSKLEELAGSYAINVYMTGLERIRQQLRALGSAASLVPGLGGASIGFHLASGILGAALAQRHGGIVKAAQGAVVNSPTVLFGERGTGQEVFVPQNISRQRGLALSAVAAGMHGASVVPNERMGGGGSGPLIFNYSGGGSALDDLFMAWFHRSVRDGRIQLIAGGSKVKVG